MCVDKRILLLYKVEQQVVQIGRFLPRGIKKKRVKVLKSLYIVVVVSYSFRWIDKFGGVYPTQRVLVVDTDRCHLLYRTKTDKRDLVLPILIMYFFPGAVSIWGELQGLVSEGS